MSLQRCEFCGRMFAPEGNDPTGRHCCCGVRSAGELTGVIEGTCRIRGELGSGSTGTVYLATQLRLQRTVALKILNRNELNAAQNERLFFSEIRAAGKLVHPHIVRIYSVGENDRGVPYAIMEYIDGVTLEEILEQRKTLPEAEVRQIAAEIADALRYAWQTAELSHGDLKPANIMLRRADDSVCIFDLGLQAARKENNIHTAMGTPLYAAPELINDTFGSNDFRADVYSLGIMLYELISGHAPFEGTPEEIVRQHLHEDPPPLRQRVPEVSADLAGLAARMISRYAPERPDWDEVLKVLRCEPPGVQPSAPKPAKPAKPAGMFPAIRMLALFLIGLILSGMLGYTLAGLKPAEEKTTAKDRIAQAFLLAEKGNADELYLLLQKGVPVDAENDRGNTLLMHAVIFGRAEVARMLLNYHNPSLRHRNKLGETVYDLARDVPNIRQLLRESDADRTPSAEKPLPTRSGKRRRGIPDMDQ